MCGFSGYLRLGGAGQLDRRRVLQRMSCALTHRGPDDEGIWTDPITDFGLTHRRLSIADLSQAGHQPMHSHDGRHVLAFNGEIYNSEALRAQLHKEGSAIVWRGHSDTEVLLECLASWGLTRTLEAATGMFAFALWDRREHTLSLARDRMGEKPLYWGWQGRTLLFGSELSALKAHPDFTASVDRGALALLLRHNYIPAPHSIYEGIRKLPAGHYLVLGQDQVHDEPQPYWSYRAIVHAAMDDPFSGDARQAVDALESLLSASVAGQMMADVPLGAFLSGGIDSSLIVALMQRQSAQPVHTYAIGFENPGYDEAPHARAVAAHLGTEHTELYVSEQDALAVVPMLPQVYCEPFADSSQIPTFLVTRMARRTVTVALTGDGADELFGGYTHHQYLPRLWNLLKVMPAPLRGLVARSLAPLPLPRRLEKLASVMGARDREVLYRQTRSYWPQPQAIIPGAREPESVLRDPSAWRFVHPFAPWIMALEAIDYMPDDVLVKVDRAAMANSLETRAPFLDHQVVEFATRLPMSLKIHDGQGKWILRQLLYRHVPQVLVDRPKKGFSVPLAAWLRGPLRDWAEDLLDEQRLRLEGYFEPSAIRHAWQEHLGGKRDRSARLWSVLMFQAWLAHAQAASR